MAYSWRLALSNWVWNQLLLMHPLATRIIWLSSPLHLARNGPNIPNGLGRTALSSFCSLQGEMICTKHAQALWFSLEFSKNWFNRTTTPPLSAGWRRSLFRGSTFSSTNSDDVQICTWMSMRKLNIIYYLCHIPIVAYSVIFFIMNMARPGLCVVDEASKRTWGTVTRMFERKVWGWSTGFNGNDLNWWWQSSTRLCEAEFLGGGCPKRIDSHPQGFMDFGQFD